MYLNLATICVCKYDFSILIKKCIKICVCQAVRFYAKRNLRSKYRRITQKVVNFGICVENSSDES